MPTYRDEGVVLRTHKLGEADRIVTLLSRQHGKVRAVAKGVRRTASRFGARLEPGMVVDAQFYVGRSLDIVQQADTIGSYGADIADDYGRYTVAMAMLETADRLTDHEAGTQHYLLLVGALRSLARREHDAPPGAVRLDAATLEVLGALLAGDWPVAESADERALAQATGVVAAYTQFHLERALRSLPHVDRSGV